LETSRLKELEGERIRAGAGKLENGLFLQFSIHFIFVNLWLYKNKTLEVTEVWLGDWEIGTRKDSRISFFVLDLVDIKFRVRFFRWFFFT
jgi:hypothetical protein